MPVRQRSEHSTESLRPSSEVDSFANRGMSRFEHPMVFDCNRLMFPAFIGKDEGELDDHQIESVSVGNFYIIGSFFGAIIRHDPKLLVGTADKEDNERSVLHFIKDGRVVRLDFATVKSGYYTEKGGLQETRTANTVKIGADYMLQKYPKYVRIFQRPTGAHAGMWEVDHL